MESKKSQRDSGHSLTHSFQFARLGPGNSRSDLASDLRRPRAGRLRAEHSICSVLVCLPSLVWHCADFVRVAFKGNEF